MPATQKQSPNLSLREAAADIGVHHATLKRWIDDGEGPPALVKPGPFRSTIRIRRADLERWLAQPEGEAREITEAAIRRLTG